MSKKSHKKFYAVLRGYLGESIRNFRNAMYATAQTLANSLGTMPKNATVEDKAERMYNTFVFDWMDKFTQPQNKTVTKWAAQGYKRFRADRSIFLGKKTYKNSAGNIIPIEGHKMQIFEESFVNDFAQRDIAGIGSLFLGESFKADFKSWLIGTTTLELPQFKKAFLNYFFVQTAGVSSLIRNSVTVMRGYANIAYLNQIGVEKFRFFVRNESLRCANCASSDLVLETAASFNKIKQLTLDGSRQAHKRLGNIIADKIECEGSDCFCKMVGVME